MIRLSKQTDYGIVLLSHLARQPDLRLNASELAAATFLPVPMVSKVLKGLARGGLLISQRGAKGGYSLARSADTISVAEIIAAIDGPIAITECIEEGPDECSYEASCRIRGNWQLINQAVKEALDAIRLSDMSTEGFELGEAGKSTLVSLGSLERV